MSLLDTLRKNLDSETFAKVTDALGDDFNYDMVPRTRLNKVIAQRDEAKRQLAEAQSSGATSDDDDDDIQSGGEITPPKSSASFSQKDLDAAVEAERLAGETRIKEMQLKFATTEKLRELKFVDPQLVISSGLIDFTKVTTDDNGVITGGLEDQLTTIATDRPYLIASGSANTLGTGKNGGSDVFGSVTSKDDFMQLSTDKQIAFKEAYPEMFKQFMSQI